MDTSHLPTNAARDGEPDKNRKRRWVILVAAFCVGCLVFELAIKVLTPQLGSFKHRQKFHASQLEFKRRFDAANLIGLPVEQAFPHFGGRPPVFYYGRDWECHWKEWPGELVVRDGRVEGIFYHDYPYTTQPLPPNYGLTHAEPYFTRFPAHLTEEFLWDRSTFEFEKPAD